MSRTLITEWDSWFAGHDRRVQVECPKCEERYLLDHKIDDHGNISPSLDCPTEDCDFHEHCQLSHWTLDPRDAFDNTELMQ